MKYLLSTRQHDSQKMSQLAKELGFDGVEFVMPSRFDSSHPEIVPFGHLENIQAVHVPLDFYTADRFLSALSDAMSIAQAVGAEVVNIHPPSAYEGYGGPGNVQEGIAVIQRMAKVSKVRICYEVLALPTKDRHHFEKAYEDPYQWQEDVRKHSLLATLDTTHIASWDQDPATYVKLLGNNLAHIHLSDYKQDGGVQHLFPGEGDIDWPAFFAALLALQKPDIYVTFEQGNRFDVLGTDKERLANSLAFVRKLLQKTTTS